MTSANTHPRIAPPRAEPPEAMLRCGRLRTTVRAEIPLEDYRALEAAALKRHVSAPELAAVILNIVAVDDLFERLLGAAE